MLSHMLKGGGVVASPIVYSTWDPTKKSSGLQLSNGNRTAYAASDGIVRSVVHVNHNSNPGNPPANGQYAVAIHVDSYGSGIWFGFGTSAQGLSTGNYPGDSTNSWGLVSSGLDMYNGSSVGGAWSGSWSANGFTDILLQIAPTATGTIMGTSQRVNQPPFPTGSQGYGPIFWPVDPPPALDLYFFVRLTGGAQVTTDFGANPTPYFGTLTGLY